MSETTEIIYSNAKTGTVGMVTGPTVAPIAEDRSAYIAGFDGMAVAPFAAAEIAVLREPIDPNDVEIKPDGIVYMPGVFYRSRLSRAFGPGAWAIVPRGPARRMPKSGGELVVFHGALFIKGRFVAERVGHCMYYPNNAGMTYADAYEGSITDCLSRCCKDIVESVACLWEKGWRDEWQRKYCEKGEDNKWRRKNSGRTSKLSPNATPPIPAPGVGVAAPAPSVVSGPSPSAPSVPSVPASTPKVVDAEPASEAQLDALEKLAFDELKITHDFAGRWLFTTYGTRDPSKLTVAQATDALGRLKADFEKTGGK